jgi:cold shock CspA family protein
MGRCSLKGKVTFFNPERQYGFIRNEAGKFFFHETKVIGEMPAPGDLVEFWLDDADFDDRLQAVEVRVIRKASTISPLAPGGDTAVTPGL